MPELYLIDTSVWVFALRRKPQEAIRRRIEGLLDLDVVATCGLIALELLGGTANEREFTRLQKRLRGLHWLPIEDGDWEAAGSMAFSLRRAGIAVPFTDILLSTLAVRFTAVLLHADHDFELVARHCNLQVESLIEMIESP